MTDTATRDSDTTGHDTPDTGHDATHDSATDTTGSHDTATPAAWERIATYGQYIPLPRRTLAVALYDGSVDGSTKLWKWATASGWDTLKTRGSAVGGGAVITVYSIATTAPPVNGLLIAATTGTWATWALINAPSPAEKKRRAKAAEEAARKAAEDRKAKKAGRKKGPSPARTENPEPDQEETPQQAQETPLQNTPTEPSPPCRINSRNDLLNWLHEAIGNRNGIHLDELHSRLTAEPGFTTLERVHLTPLLDRHDIPYHRAISVDGIAGRTGVKRADLQALLKDSPTGGPQTP